VLVAEDQTGLAGDLTRFAETFSDLADGRAVTGYRRRGEGPRVCPVQGLYLLLCASRRDDFNWHA
jgi:hypothetical protein